EVARASTSRVAVSEALLVLSSIRRFLMSVPRFLAKWLRRSVRLQGAPVRRPARFRPAVESLEGRLTPAGTGNVMTKLVHGILSLSDTAAMSRLTISQPAANEITITADANTTVNGQNGPVTIMGVTGNLSINLSTGIDSLTFDLSQNNISVGNLSIS